MFFVTTSIVRAGLFARAELDDPRTGWAGARADVVGAARLEQLLARAP
jgi:hypothetical protein